MRIKIIEFICHSGDILNLEYCVFVSFCPWTVSNSFC